MLARWMALCFVPYGLLASPPPKLVPMPEQELRAHVEELAGKIGPRNLSRPKQLEAAARYIESHWISYGLHPNRQTYDCGGVKVSNLIAEKTGMTSPSEVIVIGAHYDSVVDSPGANDNASGIAALLWLSKVLADKPTPRTLRFVAFVNEEPPFFLTDEMGSRVYAKALAAKQIVVKAMISLETLGYFSDEPNSQKYPPIIGWFYPDKGNFIGFVGNRSSKKLVDFVETTFKKHSDLPVESARLPSWIPGVGWSDHESFWRHGYPAMMITDTALYRYPHYHLPTDLPAELDYARMAKLVSGLVPAIEALTTKD